MLALEFPPLSHIVNWPEFAGDDTYGINKVILVYFFAVVLTLLVFILGRGKDLVPRGMQNVAEISVEFIRGIVRETIGHGGERYMPFLLSLFFFIFFTNIFGIIPVIQMPASARVALPMFLAGLTWVVFIGSGVVANGPVGYLKSVLFPPGVPIFLYVLVTPIEFISVFLVRPFSLMVRLFANMLAGHILLVTFAVLTSALIVAKWYVIFLPLPFIALVFFTAFEVLVCFLQAYVFTLLAGVYIGGALHPEH